MRSDTQFERILGYFDEDGDGKVSASELRHRLSMMGGREEEKLKDLRDAFEMYDTEKCGFITPKSLNKMLKRMGESKSIDVCKMMINHFDLNGDGLLSFEEFRSMMH
ncbi:unnamed protein product [Lupinus luteus]|uniref:EF-hand domain-containing protein n=1 Tax=Lupinus luteus TaxID=3873 RepID=A0AAV1W7A3_LUPLU